MEKVIRVNLNSREKIKNSGKDVRHKVITETIPQPTYRELTYNDCRSIGILNPTFLIESLSTDLSKCENIEALVKKNPELKRLLKKYKLTIKNRGYNSQLYTNDHMKQTALLASKICDSINKKVDRTRIIKAARLHDVGKIFIPSEILNKPDKLTPEERKIMNVHAELGHKLLETLKIDSKTLELIKNHHNYNENSSLEQQIVSAADIYTALTEERPYKKSTSKERALEIVSTYGFSNDVINALKKAV